MKILFLINGAYLPQAIGGAEWSTHHFAKGLQGIGHSVAVVAQLKNAGWLGFRNKVSRKISRDVFPEDRTMGYPTFRGWNLFSGLNDAVSHFAPEVVVVAGIGSGAIPICIEARNLGLKVVYSVMDVSFYHHGGDLKCLKDVHFISNSEFTRRRLHDLYNISSVVIRPPIDASRCRAVANGNKVVMVNPRESKGGLIAFSLAESRKDIPFAFYETWSGDTRLLRERAKAAGNIEWNRAVLDLKKLYRNARILLVPSQAEEAWGMVASEAHCSGIPVIGSDIGGLSEAIGSGGIRIAPTAPISEWLDALDRLWRDEKEWLRISEAALAYSKRSEIQLGTQISILNSLLESIVMPKGQSYGFGDNEPISYTETELN